MARHRSVTTVIIITDNGTGQYGSSTVLQHVNDQSDEQCVLILLCVGSCSTDSWGCGLKTGGVLLC